MLSACESGALLMYPRSHNKTAAKRRSALAMKQLAFFPIEASEQDGGVTPFAGQQCPCTHASHEGDWAVWAVYPLLPALMSR